MPRSYSREFRGRAVRLVEDRVREGLMESQTQAILDTAVKLGVARETLRRWVVQSRVDFGTRPGLTTSESEEIRRLRKENAELKRANEILKLASASFASELDPQRQK